MTKSAGEQLLSAVGVSATEELVYRQLLDGHSGSVEELVQVLGVESRSVRQTLASLESKGLASRLAGRPARFAPTPPHAAINLLILQREQELERARQGVAQLLERFRHTAAVGDAGEIVELVNGREAYAQRFLQLERGATRQFLSLTQPPYITDDQACKEEGIAGLNRHVHYRTIYAAHALERPGMLDAVRSFIEAGEDARVLPNVPLKLSIADNDQALIPLVLEPGREQGIIVHSSSLLNALTTLFETLWAQADPIRIVNGQASTHHRRADALSDVDHRIIELMAMGFRDEAIAAQLGLGLSTVQRRVKRILDMLDTRTRFQAALALQDRGLLNSRSKA